MECTSPILHAMRLIKYYVDQIIGKFLIAPKIFKTTVIIKYFWTDKNHVEPTLSQLLVMNFNQNFYL